MTNPRKRWRSISPPRQHQNQKRHHADHIESFTSPSLPGDKKVATIHDLPEELLVHVIQALADDTRAAAHLGKLCLTSRLFCRLATEHLYRRFDHRCRPYPFLRTLLSNPHLGKHVREVHFDRSAYVGSDALSLIGIPSMEDASWAEDRKVIDRTYGREFLRNFEARIPDVEVVESFNDMPSSESLSGLGFDDFALRNRWLDANRKVEEFRDIMNAAIVSLAPNITSILAEPVRGRSNPDTWLQIVGKTSSVRLTNSLFENIRVVQLIRLEDAAAIAPVLQLESLRRLVLMEPSMMMFFLPLSLPGDTSPLLQLSKTIPTSSSNLEHLELRKGYINKDILAVLVASSKALKSISLNIGEVWLSTSGYLATYARLLAREVAPTWTLKTAIASQSSTLESLWLDWPCSTEAYAPALEWSGPFPDLSNFQVLKHLTCPSAYLLNDTLSSTIRNMPDTLTDLRLLDLNLKTRGKYLKELAHHSPSFIPNLGAIIVSAGEVFRYDGKHWMECEEDLAAVEITLILEPDAMYEFEPLRTNQFEDSKYRNR